MSPQTDIIETVKIYDLGGNSNHERWERIQLETQDTFLASLEKAADESSNESDSFKLQFMSILSVATQLLCHIENDRTFNSLRKKSSSSKITHQTMRKASDGQIEMFMKACSYSYTSISRILQLIGGFDGNNIDEMSMQQLLDVISYCKFYHSTIKKLYPKLQLFDDANGQIVQKPHLNDLPELFDSSTINKDRSIDGSMLFDGLNWVCLCSLEIKRLCHDEVLIRTREDTDTWLKKVYSTKRDIRQTRQKILITSLCEDVFSLALLHLETLREQIGEDNPELHVMLICLVLSRMRHQQIEFRFRNEKKSMEAYCAAANDYIRMSQKVEELQSEIISSPSVNFSRQLESTISEACDALAGGYMSEAAYTVSLTTRNVFEPIEASITPKLFGREWEKNLTHNDLARQITKTLEDFLSDMNTFFCNKYLLQKFLASLSRAIPTYYMTTFLALAETKKIKSSIFQDTAIAIKRMKDDIVIFKKFLIQFKSTLPTLKRIVERDFLPLISITEFAGNIQNGLNGSVCKDFAIFLCARLQSVALTKLVIGDVIRIIRAKDEKKGIKLINEIHDRLLQISTEAGKCKQNNDEFFCLELNSAHALKNMYKKSRRKRYEL